jgi:hypothetical protein
MDEHHQPSVLEILPFFCNPPEIIIKKVELNARPETRVDKAYIQKYKRNLVQVSKRQNRWNRHATSPPEE